MNRYELEFRQKGFTRIAGVDEAGRGPLAGPVAAATVILPENHGILHLNDSKQLSPALREELFYKIRENAVAVGVGLVDSQEIEKINILQATRRAMKQAVESCKVQPDFLLIDGITPIETDIQLLTIKKGDSLSESIAAASIIAKVTRDQLMEKYHETFPEYLFNKHKGYGTKVHLERIKKYGPSPIHRKTFKGVKEYVSS